MMFTKQPLVIDHVDWPKILSNPPLLTSFQSGWSSIQLNHCCQTSIDFPEISTPQHMIIIPLGLQTFDYEITLESCLKKVSYREKDLENGCIQIMTANLPHSFRSNLTIEWIHYYLEPTFLSQIGLALKSSLEENGGGSRLYADSIATALAAHLLGHYSTRNHHFREYEDGLSKQKLQQAVEYIQAHLGEDLSLAEIANQLGMSQYYFCRLFKRSTGMSPHQYLIRQRVEQAKYLLKQPDRTITSVAIECGFANQSHFAKCFRQRTGMNPKQFRKSEQDFVQDRKKMCDYI
jgi:AraC family transcriptional regulator